MGRTIEEVLSADLSAKKKVAALADGLLAGSIERSAWAEAQRTAEVVNRGTLLEAMERATRSRPDLVDAGLFELLVGCLAEDAPRVKWEAARTIAKVAPHHPDALAPAVDALLANARHEGTVVRWAGAHALAAILRSGHAPADLAEEMARLRDDEADAGARKVYEKALERRR